MSGNGTFSKLISGIGKDDKLTLAERPKKISSKRLTLVPGFLNNCVTSGTVKKCNSKEDIQILNNKKNKCRNIFNKTANVRRSERIKKKYQNGKDTMNPNNTDQNDRSSYCDFDATFTNSDYNIKPVSKSKTQSIFKEIDKKLKVNCEELKRSYSEEENSNRHSFVMDFPTPPRANHNSNTNDNNTFSLKINRSFCKDIETQLRVKLIQKEENNCLLRIRNDMKNVNLALEGRLEDIDNDGILNLNIAKKPSKLVPPKPPPRQYNTANSNNNDYNHLPPEKWIYSTPTHQKVKSNDKEADIRNLQYGLLHSDNNQLSLYEFIKDSNANYNGLNHFNNNEVVPLVESRFLTAVEQSATGQPLIQVDTYSSRFTQYQCDGGSQNNNIFHFDVDNNNIYDNDGLPVVYSRKQYNVENPDFTEPTNFQMMNLCQAKQPIETTNLFINNNMNNAIINEQDFTLIGNDNNSFELISTQQQHHAKPTRKRNLSDIGVEQDPNNDNECCQLHNREIIGESIDSRKKCCFRDCPTKKQSSHGSNTFHLVM